MTEEDRDLAVEIAREMVYDALRDLADDGMGFAERLWDEYPAGVEDEVYEEMLKVFDDVVKEAREILS